MACFFKERKKDGEMYPPATLKDLFASIQHFYCNELGMAISMFKDKDFHDTRIVLDAQMKKRARKGLVKPKKKAVVITYEDEDSIWRSGSFGYSNGFQLVRTLIYHFSLCST